MKIHRNPQNVCESISESIKDIVYKIDIEFIKFINISVEQLENKLLKYYLK